MKTLFRILPVLALASAICGTGARAGEAPPVVVELFTSQGCNSCPPADRVMGELSARADVIGLSYHVDYWDYIGWRDTFALQASAERQRNYVARSGGRYVYTPQVVVGGHDSVTATSLGAIERAVQAEPVSPVLLETAALGPGRFAVRAPAMPVGGMAAIWLVTFDSRHDVQVQRGENAGRTLSYFNVVRDVRQLALWDGSAPLDVELDMATAWRDGHDGCAVIVQAEGFGRVLGATRIVRPATGG